MVKNFRSDVDVVAGCFYGDEGKGQVAKFLADRATTQNQPYIWTARVGGQNAEHRITHQACDFTCRVLPSASAYRENILAILGAGHVFIPEHLLLEAVHLGVPLGRIFVDKQAMWLKPEHAKANLEIANLRGSTGWGIGQATAEKVLRRPGTRLAGDSVLLQEALGDHLCNVSEKLDHLLGPGLFEGSQGAFLSLDQGRYPFCTAKNVTVPGMLGELGIGVRRLRAVIGVTRLVMMRVPGPSGPTGGAEITQDEVEERCGLRIPNHRRLQGDSTLWKASTKGEKADEERLFDISLEELYRSHCLNNYDALAVTFADYVEKGNYRARRWEDLGQKTRELITEIDKTIAPVFLVRTGQGEFDYIER